MIEVQILISECDKRIASKLKRAVLKVFKITDEKGECALTITIGNDEFVHELNKTYRNVDRTTDVLSFSEDYEIPGTSTHYLGDIAISYPTALQQANEAGHGVEDELTLLTIHGTLHLLGYDHHQEHEKKEMWNIQHQTLEALGINMAHFSGDE